jgi:hypothetical protein
MQFVSCAAARCWAAHRALEGIAIWICANGSGPGAIAAHALVADTYLACGAGNNDQIAVAGSREELVRAIASVKVWHVAEFLSATAGLESSPHSAARQQIIVTLVVRLPEWLASLSHAHVVE